MGAIYTYNRGKFIFGKNSNEVNQAWQGQDNPTREVRVGDSTIWPSFSVGAVSNTFTFTPSADSLKSQGDFTIVSENGVSKYKVTNKAIDENVPIEIDPAGGSGTIGIMTRESSLWHQLSLVGQITQTNSDSAKINSFTITAPSYVIAEVEQSTSTEENNHYTSSFTLKVNSDDGKSTKLTKEQEHDVNYMPTGNYDILLNWSIKPNNTPNEAYAEFRLNSFYDLLGNQYDIEDNNLLFSVRQKSNILYYVHLAFLDETQGNNYINNGAIETSDSITVDYNAKTTTFYTFVELGISPDGGNTIYWNDNERGSLINDDVQVSALKLSVDNTTALQYSVKVIEHNKTKPNLFKCIINANYENDENSNPNGMSQVYSIEKYFPNLQEGIEICDDLQCSMNNRISVALADSDNGSKATEVFKISRSTATQPISANIIARFDYGNYHI